MPKRCFKRANIHSPVNVDEDRRNRTLKPLNQPDQQAGVRVGGDEKSQFHAPWNINRTSSAIETQ
jgi:hypothetical protein